MTPFSTLKAEDIEELHDKLCEAHSGTLKPEDIKDNGRYFAIPDPNKIPKKYFGAKIIN